jgi:hypothetical protein
MSNILESPDWKKIEQNVARDYKRFRRTIMALTLLTALHTTSVVDAPLLEAAQTQADVFRHGFMSLEHPAWPSASAPTQNPLFNPHTKPLELTDAQVADVVTVITGSPRHS